MYYTQSMQETPGTWENNQTQQTPLNTLSHQRRRLPNRFIVTGIIILVFLFCFFYFHKAQNKDNIQSMNTPQQDITGNPTPTGQIKHWVIAAYVTYELKTDTNGSQFVQSLNNPSTYEIFDRNLKKPDLLPKATHVASFQSYQAIQTAFADHKIASLIKVILYDNERWPGTPLREQEQPFTYVPLAEKLVHQHGLLFMNTPAADLNTTLEGNKLYNNYDGYIHLQLGTLAKYTDIFEIQAQRAGSVAKYITFANKAMAQARRANSEAVILLGITTSVSTSQELIDEIHATEQITDGYWINVIGGNTGAAIAIPVIKALQSDK